MIILFDIGGSHMRVAASRDGKAIDPPAVFDTPKDFGAPVALLKKTAEGFAGAEKIKCAAGGVPGPLNHAKTELLRAPHLPQWVGKPLKEAFERVCNAPIMIENDAAVAALGEANDGVGKGAGIVAYITIGTGVGGARIVNGRIDANTFGFEIGHQIIQADGPSCIGCGGNGHFETYVSGSGIEEKYKKKPEDIIDKAIWDDIARFVAIGLNNAIVHWSPEVVVIGGSVGLAKRLSLDIIEAHLKELLTIFKKQPHIAKAELGDRAGLRGALRLIQQTL